MHPYLRESKAEAAWARGQHARASHLCDRGEVSAAVCELRQNGVVPRNEGVDERHDGVCGCVLNVGSTGPQNATIKVVQGEADCVLVFSKSVAQGRLRMVSADGSVDTLAPSRGSCVPCTCGSPCAGTGGVARCRFVFATSHRFCTREGEVAKHNLALLRAHTPTLCPQLQQRLDGWSQTPARLWQAKPLTAALALPSC